MDVEEEMNRRFKVQQLLLNAPRPSICVFVCVYWPNSCPSTCGSIWLLMTIWARRTSPITPHSPSPGDLKCLLIRADVSFRLIFLSVSSECAV